VGLTSPALLYLLALCALGLLLAIIIDWRAMAGRNARSIVLRAVSLVGLQFFVLAFILVAVNRSGEFYSSWSDLLGLDKASGSVVASPNTAASRVQPVVVTSKTAVPVPGSKATGGVLQTVTFHGQTSGVSVGGQVFVPAGYRPGSPVGRYPVLMEISNNLTSTSSPYSAARFAETAARQIATGQLKPLIIVMVPATVAGVDQGCLDAPARPAVGNLPPEPAILAATFFSQDLPAIAESQYGASNNSANWGLLGDSSGGYCALQLAMTHSWVFSAAAAPSGAYTQPPGPLVDAGSPQLKRQDNLQWLLRNQPMQPVSLLFTHSTTTSGTSAAADQLFSATATRPTQVSTLAIGGGGWPFAPVLDWIGTAIAPRTGPVPAAMAR
jgi:enterochelin esterase-like enzyme